MAIFDISRYKVTPDVEYATRQEMELLSKLVADSPVYRMRCNSCERCSALIPDTKRWCSKKCMEDEDNGE